MAIEAAKRGAAAPEVLVALDPDAVRPLMRSAPHEVLEAALTGTVGAAEGERTAERRGRRAGDDDRTRVGELARRVPRDREGGASAAPLERCQRSARASVAAPAERYVQGVPTRKVQAITEEWRGHRFAASGIGATDQRLAARRARLAGRRLEEGHPWARPALRLDHREPSIPCGAEGSGAGAPEQRPGGLVVLLDDAVEGGLQVDDGVEGAVFQAAAGELGEGALDRVQPSKARRPSLRSLNGTRPAGAGGRGRSA